VLTSSWCSGNIDWFVGGGFLCGSVRGGSELDLRRNFGVCGLGYISRGVSSRGERSGILLLDFVVDTFAGRSLWSVVMGDFFLNMTESDLLALGVPGVFFLEEAPEL
jgi:hypothetical protein